jgi:RNA polymerase sigma-70 factor, ECF subfamily
MSKDLFERWVAGEASAFHNLYQFYYPRLVDFSTALIGNPAEGEDLSQETLVRLYGAKEKLKEEGVKNGRALVYTIARRLAYQYAAYRSRWRRLALKQEDIQEVLMHTARVSPDELLATAETKEYIQLALNHLPEPQREIILLYHHQHLSYRETAQILGCSVAQLKSRLHYARKLLRGRLQEMGVVPEP